MYKLKIALYEIILILCRIEKKTCLQTVYVIYFFMWFVTQEQALESRFLFAELYVFEAKQLAATRSHSQTAAWHLLLEAVETDLSQ